MKASTWVSIATPLLLVGLCQGHLKPGHSFEPTLERRGVDAESGGFDDEFPRHVYRGEIQRTPKQVQNDGGFYSRGMQRILSGDQLSWEELEDGSSLFRHAAGDTAQFTRYVSTSADPATSLTFAVNDEDPGEKGYIYKIHADKRMVDVNRSLGKYSPYPAQNEHAAIGFIPFDQIEGWWEVTYKHDFADPKVGKKTQDKLRRGQLKRFHKNPHFNPNFQKLRGNGEAPQLAGFPRLSTAWDEDTWKQFKTLPVSKSLDDMIDAVCTGNGNDNCIKQLGQPESKPTKPKASPSGPMDPAKPKSLATGFRVYAKAGTLVGFNVLAPYLRNVLNQLREWDHPIGWAVKELDDSINDFQEYIGGPRRNDISGNDNQAALINFFKQVFWILEGPRRRPQDLQLLSYGKRNKMRLISVNDVLRTCERVDETPPDEHPLKMASVRTRRGQFSGHESRPLNRRVSIMTAPSVETGKRRRSSRQDRLSVVFAAPTGTPTRANAEMRRACCSGHSKRVALEPAQSSAKEGRRRHSARQVKLSAKLAGSIGIRRAANVGTRLGCCSGRRSTCPASSLYTHRKNVAAAMT